MKNVLLALVGILLLINICLQAANLYYRHRARKPDVITLNRESVLHMGNHPIQGKANTPIIIVEFGDYECAYCLRHGRETLPLLRKKFIDRGIIRYAYMNSPLRGHRNARFLAVSAMCAGEQTFYWEMHDKLIEKQPSSYSEVLSIAESLGLDCTAFDVCLKKHTTDNRIDDDLQQAGRLGIQAVPSFVVGTIGQDGNVLVQEVISGAHPISVFERSIGRIHTE